MPQEDFRATELTSSPADAHLAMLALLHSVIVAAAARRQDDLPGLVETLQDDVVMTTGETSRAAYGWFKKAAWRYGDRRVHELFLNADRAILHPTVGTGESVLVTLLHEACHVWARAEYADLVSELEHSLVLTREPARITRGNSGTAASGDGDGEVGGPGPAGTNGVNKYVFASCRCQDGRRNRITIRLARGSWRPGVICCGVCQVPFAES
jgi:hypothetical protein